MLDFSHLIAIGFITVPVLQTNDNFQLLGVTCHFQQYDFLKTTLPGWTEIANFPQEKTNLK